MVQGQREFGCVRPPFERPVSPDDAFLGNTTRHFVSGIITSVLEGQRCCAFLGEPGIGKTVLLDVIADALGREGTAVVRFAAPHPEPLALQGAIAATLDLPLSEAADPADLVAAVAASGRTAPVLLVLDDAHLLPVGTLRYVWLLSELFAPHPARLQVLLAGRPALAARLHDGSLEKLRAAVGPMWPVPALDADEVEPYLDHKLRAAGSSRRRVMSESAVDALDEQAGGVPGEIDLFAARAMALRRGVGRIDGRTVRLVATNGHLARRRLAGLPVSVLVAAGTGAALAAAGLGVFLLMQDGGVDPPREAGLLPAPPATRPAAPAPAVQPAPAAVPGGIPDGGDTGQAVPPPPPPVVADGAAGVPAATDPPPPAAPGLLLIAAAGDTVPALYRKVYYGLTPPPYADVAALNPARPRPGDRLVFPAPPNGWKR